MNPLVVGCAVAGVLAGPPLLALYERGGVDGTTALTRWAIIAALCSVGAAMIMNLMNRYQQEWAEKDELEAKIAAQAAAEAEARRLAEEAAARHEAEQQAQQQA